MNYKEALIKFSKSYKDRYSVEFPTIFSFCDFQNKSVLEIGSGIEGYFVKEALKLTKKIVASDVSKDILEILRKNVNVETLVAKAENLPFSDKTFDVVFSRWVAQEVKDLKKAIKEMCRVSKECVIIVLPSEEGNETEMLEIKFHDKYTYRKERIENIKKWISECGFEVKDKRKLLQFLFSDVDEAVEIFSALGFENKLSDIEKSRLKDFFLKKEKRDGVHFTQGAAFICGYRK